MLHCLRTRRDLNSSLSRDAVRVLDHGLCDLAMPLPQASRGIVRESLTNLVQTGFLAAGTRIEHENLHSSVGPSPVLDLWNIIAVLVHILLVLHQLVAQELLEMGAYALQFGHAIHYVAGKMVAIEVIHHRHVERRRGCALFLVSADVQAIVTSTTVSEPMDQPGISVIGEDDRLIGGEHGIEFAI